MNLITTPGGLVVPTSALPDKTAERWPASDVRILRRAVKVLRQHGMSLALVCTDPQCQADPLVTQARELDRNDADVTVLTCQHAVRRLPGVL